MAVATSERAHGMGTVERSDADPAVIEVEHLTKSYGDLVAVDDVSFQVGRGEIFGILGRNGAGKTTTVEILQGLRRPDGGRLRVLGLDPTRDTTRLRRRIGSQLQDSALPDRIKVREALDLFASTARAPVDRSRVLEEWGLAGRARSSFASLSGGERQRLFVALALMTQPEVVFLDELTQGLDPAARRVAWDLIKQIRDRGTTVVLVTHFMDEAEHLSDRIAVMDRGRVKALDTPQGLVARYGSWAEVVFTEADDVSWLRRVPGVDRLERRGVVNRVTGSGTAPALVIAELVAHGVVPEDLRVVRPTLEDVFLSITGDQEGEKR
jgi:ABC-2 type transport system ATP-binding protein